MGERTLNGMKYFLLLIISLMIMAGCSSKDMVTKVNIKEDPKVESIYTSQNSPTEESKKEMEVTITIENSNIEPVQNIPMVASINEKIPEQPSAAQVYSQGADKDLMLDGDQSEDFIIIEDTKYINLMHEEKFSDWIMVAKKYGAALYGIPYSDGFAIIKDGKVLVGMSLGVAGAQSENIDILCDLMADKGIHKADIIEGIKHVNQTEESVHLVGPEEFDDDFSIFKQDDWIVVSW